MSKRITIALLATFLAIGVTACKPKETTTTTTETTTSATSSTDGQVSAAVSQ